MGQCAICQTNQASPQLLRSRISSFNTIPESRLVSESSTHDEKFYFIPNEENIDILIAKLSDIESLEYGQLEEIDNCIGQLTTLEQKFDESIDKNDNLNILQTDQERIKILKKTISEYTNRSSKIKKIIKNGVLSIDVQNGLILSNEFKKKTKVIVKIYKTNKIIKRLHEKYQLTEICSYETDYSLKILNPQWESLFEHYFADIEDVRLYFFGLNLVYLEEETEKVIALNEVKFSLDFMLDQKLHLREIDIKAPEETTALAKILVRFQFIHDLNEIKDIIIKDIKTKLMRLYMIKDNLTQSSPRRGKFDFAKASFLSESDAHSSSYYIE